MSRPSLPSLSSAAALLAALCAAVAVGASVSGCVGPSSRRAFHFAGYRLSGKAPQEDCWAGRDYRACAYLSRSGPRDPKTVLWFFHYAEGDERSFDRIGLAREFFARAARDGAAAPTVVSVSFGSHWLLSARLGRRQTVAAEDFASRVMPEVEARVGAPARRLAWGMSMGGWNAAELSLLKPGLFSRVALSCPALYDTDPFETRGKTPKQEDGRDLFRARLAGSAQWDEDDPVALARSASASGGAAFLLQPNERDEFGFQGGARALAAALGQRASLSPAPDGHCNVDADEAADFLTAP